MSKNRIKQAVALLLALVLVVGGVALNPTPATAASGKNIKVGDACYTILPAGNKTVEYVKPATKTCTTASIPDTVKISGKTYQVTSIGANAFKGCTKLKLVTVGYYVKKIGKKSFYGCKGLKDIIIHTTKLTSGNVGSNAFKGISSKAVVAVPKEKLASYKKVLKAKGVTGKNQKIKENKYINEFNPKESQFEIGDPTGVIGGTPTYFMFVNPRTKIGIEKTSQYFAGDTVKLESQFQLLPGIYGHWENDPRELTQNISCCNYCKKCFTDTTFAMHNVLDMWLDHEHTCIPAWWTIFNANGKHLHSYVFVPDPDPCKAVISFTLPESLSCNAKDVKVTNKVEHIDLTSACKISVSGKKITVTIDDVKQEPFYKRFNYEAYMKDMHYQEPKTGDGEIMEHFRNGVTVTVDAKVGSNVEKDNTIKNSMTYYYKGVSHTEDFKLSFHTASMKIAANTDTNGNSLEGAEFDLYRTTTTYDYETNTGIGDWSLFASGLHVGDVVNGLGTGYQANVEGEYRLVQTKAPDGYRQAQPFDFMLTIDTNGKTKITAVDDDDNELPVENGTVMVTFVNYGKPSGKPGNTSTETPSAGGSTGGDTGNSSTGGSQGSTGDAGNVEKKAVATYYKDGVRQFWYTHGAEEFDADGMMSTASVSNYAVAFEGCRLEKITVNGETVDALPEKVPYGTQIGFWYVSN